jgi:hypothetical protein
MSHIKPMHKERYSDCKLERVVGKEDVDPVVMFKLIPPKRFGWANIIFTPIGVFVGGDLRFGDTPGGQATSSQGWDLFGMLGRCEEEYLGEKFFGRCPSGPKAKAQWSNDVGWLSAMQQEFVRCYTNLIEGEEKAAKDLKNALNDLMKLVDARGVSSKHLELEVYKIQAAGGSKINNSGGIYDQVELILDSQPGNLAERKKIVEHLLKNITITK